MIFAIIIGFLSGAVVALLVSKKLLMLMQDRMATNPEQRRYMKSVAIVFGAIALAPSIFLTVMVGAYFSGYNAQTETDILGMGEASIPVVLALGLVLVITIMVTSAAAVGAGLGFMAARK